MRTKEVVILAPSVTEDSIVIEGIKVGDDTKAQFRRLQLMKGRQCAIMGLLCDSVEDTGVVAIEAEGELQALEIGRRCGVAMGSRHHNGACHVHARRLGQTSLKSANQAVETADQVHFQKHQVPVPIA